MRSKYIIAIVIILLISLVASIVLNFLLFNFSQHYYFQLNSLRLDPLGIDYFPDDDVQPNDSGSKPVLVVFYGDSRAAEWPAPFLDGFEFVNRGIGAQTSAQVMQRYDAHITPLQPDVLVVQVCINDLKTIPLFPESKADIIDICKKNIQRIVQQATEQGATVVLSTIFPVGQFPLQRRIYWSEEIPLAVEEVNTFINSLAGERVIIFDAFAILADEDGQLAEEYGRDELHLNSAGYEAINRQFEELLKSLGE